MTVIGVADADARFGQQLVQRVNGRHRLAGELHNHIAHLQARAFRRAARFHGHHQQSRFHRQIVEPHHPPVQFHVLAAHADVAAPDFAVLDQPAGDVLGRVNRDGEADALRRQNHRAVHADDFAARIDQRPAGIARVQRRVGLDDVVHQPAGIRAQRPAQRAHHARRHGVLKAVRIADGDGELADAQALRFAQFRRGQVRRVNAQHRQVRVRVFAHQMRVRPAAVVQRHFNLARAVHHVAVRQHQSVRADDETRAAARARVSPRPRHALVDFDVHHRMADLVRGLHHRAGIGVQQVAILRRRGGRGGGNHRAVALVQNGLDGCLLLEIKARVDHVKLSGPAGHSFGPAGPFGENNAVLPRVKWRLRLPTLGCILKKFMRIHEIRASLFRTAIVSISGKSTTCRDLSGYIRVSTASSIRVCPICVRVLTTFIRVSRGSGGIQPFIFISDPHCGPPSLLGRVLKRLFCMRLRGRPGGAFRCTPPHFAVCLFIPLRGFIPLHRKNLWWEKAGEGESRRVINHLQLANTEQK